MIEFPRISCIISGVIPANQTKERPVHELFPVANWNTSSNVNSCLFSQGKTPEFTKMGEIPELFVLALSLVWFARATPDNWHSSLWQGREIRIAIALEQERFSGPSPKKTTCSFSYRLRGNPGIRGLYQAIRVARKGWFASENPRFLWCPGGFFEPLQRPDGFVTQQEDHKAIATGHPF